MVTEIPEADYATIFQLPIHVLAQQTAGLTILQLQSLYLNAKENQELLNLNTITQKKKELIESEAYGLLEFVESAFSLKDVAGHRLAKEHLQLTKALKGQTEVLPMGHLVCESVETGKLLIQALKMAVFRW